MRTHILHYQVFSLRTILPSNAGGGFSFSWEIMLFRESISAFLGVCKEEGNFMNTCTHAYIHTYIQTYVHTYIHTYIHAYIHTYISTNKGVSMLLTSYLCQVQVEHSAVAALACVGSPPSSPGPQRPLAPSVPRSHPVDHLDRDGESRRGGRGEGGEGKE